MFIIYKGYLSCIHSQNDLDKYFKTMDKIVGERQTISRVRFLMMDVIDLRQNNWVPRREDNKPKTKAQVQEVCTFYFFDI